MVWNHPQCFCWMAIKSTLCRNCPCRSQAFTPNCSSVIDRTAAQNSGGSHRGPPPPTLEGMTVLEIWPISESAFDITVSLKRHRMLYPAYVKNNLVSGGHLDCGEGGLSLQAGLDSRSLDGAVPTMLTKLKLSGVFYGPLRANSCLSECGDFTLWLSWGKVFCFCFVVF